MQQPPVVQPPPDVPHGAVVAGAPGLLQPPPLPRIPFGERRELRGFLPQGRHLGRRDADLDGVQHERQQREERGLGGPQVGQRPGVVGRGPGHELGQLLAGAPGVQRIVPGVTGQQRFVALVCRREPLRDRGAPFLQRPDHGRLRLRDETPHRVLLDEPHPLVVRVRGRRDGVPGAGSGGQHDDGVLRVPARDLVVDLLR
ncbi:hypothetical protein ABZ202_15250 [Streptomyces sp. NPDC006186]|uniref:hypothetical protein n=1 Tax=Streptomyces sp. NPDC006186 TaxID=3155248 RepID=UPI0033B0A4FA